MSASTKPTATTTERPTLRKKLSRKFSSLSLKRAVSRKDEPAPPVPRLDRKTTSSSSSSSSTSSTSPPPTPLDAETAKAIISYAYPVWRVDPALIGCFVVL